MIVELCFYQVFIDVELVGLIGLLKASGSTPEKNGPNIDPCDTQL